MLYDAIIIGCGLNGMIKYLSLTNLGLKCCIIELKKNIEDNFLNDNRTIAISTSTQSFFNDLGVWSDLQNDFGKIDYIYTFEKSTKPILEFARDTVFDGELGYIVLASKLLRTMFDKIKKEDLFCGSCVSSITQDESFCYIKTQSGSSFKSKALFVCDGKNSKISQMLGVKKFTQSYNQSAITFIAKHQNPHNNIAVEQFAAQGPFATLPMKDPYQSGFVWSLRSDIANFVYSEYAKNPRGFVNLINNELTRIKSIGFIKSPDNIVSKPNFYPLEISCLKKRVMGRIMFLGDGLNAIHPVAGQAFNMAVNDIKIIRDNIKTNLSLGLDFGIESYLKSGSFDILKNHLSLNFSTSFLVRLYSNNNPILKLSRTLGLGAFGSSKFLTNLALKVASGN